MSALSPKPGDLIQDLDTPVLLVDLDRLDHNISDWQAFMDRCRVAFRPHIKTHKIPEIAAWQMRVGARGIICAKISEAEPFATAGINDICIAYPVFGVSKWQRIAAMARQGVRMTVNCDSADAARGLSAAAVAANVKINLQIDIDSGLHRGGISISDITGVERLARTIVALPGVEFDGITTFRSNTYPSAPTATDVGREEGGMLVELAQSLRARGVEVREVTAGSTPTGQSVAEVPGITESRAGTYVFNDLMQLENGTATEAQLALSVLCTVVSHQSPGVLTIDGGSKTFSSEAPARGLNPSTGHTIARAVNLPIYVERLSEEHGIARVEQNTKVQLGDKIRFTPYHACVCVNLSDQLVGVRRDRVEVVWPVAARGMRT